MSGRIGIIGTREPDTQQIVLCKELTKILVAAGFEIATGNADGIDSISMSESPSKCHVFLPWKDYNPQYVASYKPASVTVYDPEIHQEWAKSVRKYHPNSQNLTQGAFKLHARNYGIIAPCIGVIAFPNAGNGGGTAQGIRITRALHIPIEVLKTGNKPQTAQRFVDAVVANIINPNLGR